MRVNNGSEEYLDDNDLLGEINIPFDLPDVMLNGKMRHNIMLIVKESLHNIVKHAQASKVCLDLKINISVLDLWCSFQF